MKLFKKFLAAAMIPLVMGVGAVKTAPEQATAAKDKNNDDWLTTNGNKIVDMNGNEVWLTGVNWFGFNTGSGVFDGVWMYSMREGLKTIADCGFNILRVPMPAELLLNWRDGKKDTRTPMVDFERNPELQNNYIWNDPVDGSNHPNWTNPQLKTSMEIFDIAMEMCKEYGLKVMVDIHSAEIDAVGHQQPVWYTGKISTKDYYESLEWLTAKFKNDDTLIAIDLKNEPHGKATDPHMARWDNSTHPDNWKLVAETAGKKVLDINPNMLILIEGTEVYPKFENGADWNSQTGGYGSPPNYHGTWWGGNFRGVKEFPADFGSAKYNKQIVYSPHDYGPAVWEQDWFKSSFTKESLYNDCWRDNWMFIHENNIAPLLIGEWGGWLMNDLDERGPADKNTPKNEQWMTYLREFMIENRIHHTFWCFNANSSDTGGIMCDNFQKFNTPKYEFVKPALWQTKDGKFIGLDHEVPIGKNGISLNEYVKGSGGNTNPTTATAEATTKATTTETVTELTTVKSGVRYGDVNCDGEVTIDDVVKLRLYLLNGASYPLDDDAIANSKVIVGQSSIQGNCAVTIQDFVVEKIKTLPIVLQS